MGKYIFLSGGITGLPPEKGLKWRTYVKHTIEEDSDVRVINPHIDYSSFSDQEARDWDLYWLKKSFLVVVNFNDVRSIGTAQEVAIAKEYGIPVIGLVDVNLVAQLHPWLKTCCTKLFVDSGSGLDDLIEYINNYYIHF